MPLVSVSSAIDNKIYTLESGQATFSQKSLLSSTITYPKGTAIYFNDKYYVFVLNGSTYETLTSTDLVTWTKYTNNLASIQEDYFQEVHPFVFNNKMWIFSDYYYDNTDEIDYASNRLFYSTDGLTWTKISLSTVTGMYKGACVFNGEIYLIGGNPASVFKSSDGNTFTKLTTNGLLGGNSVSKTVVFNGKIYVINDKKCYYSSDGITWFASTIFSSTPVSGDKTETDITFFEGKLFAFLSDSIATYYSTSTDGITWAAAVNSGMPERIYLNIINPEEFSTQVLTTISLGTTEFSTVATVNINPTVSTIHQVSLNIDTLSTLDFAIGLLGVLSVPLSLDSLSEVNIIPVVSNGVLRSLKGIVRMNGNPVQGADVIAVYDGDKTKDFLGKTDANGQYEIVIPSTGFYHVMSVFKDSNGNPFSGMTKAYVEVTD